MLTKNLEIVVITLIMLSSSTVVPTAKSRQQESTHSYKPVTEVDAHRLAAHAEGNYIIEATVDGAACRNATLEESQALAAHDQLVPLHVVSSIHADGVIPQEAGLKIILRAPNNSRTFPGRRMLL